MEETLTLAKLDLPPPLRSFLVTTNAIENLIGTARRVSRNVTRWRSGEMILRWTAVGLIHAEAELPSHSGLSPSAPAQTCAAGSTVEA